MRLELPAGLDGHRRRIRRGGYPSRKAALEVLARLRSPRPGDGTDGVLTVGDWLAHWLVSRTSQAASTVRGYAAHIRLYLDPYLGRVLLAELTAGQVQAMFTAIIRQHHALGSPVSAATLTRIRATLRAALNAAIRRGLIAENPAAKAELPQGRRPRAVVWTRYRVEQWRRTGERPPVAVWTARQTAEFLASIDGHRLYAAYHLIALRGLRRGEASGLRWCDVDLDGRAAVISQQLQQYDGRLAVCPPKTAHSTRVIALDHTTVAALAAHRDRQQAEAAAYGPGYHASGYVFTNLNGDPMAPDRLTRMFRKLAAQAGLPPVRLHDLRQALPPRPAAACRAVTRASRPADRPPAPAAPHPPAMTVRHWPRSPVPAQGTPPVAAGTERKLTEEIPHRREQTRRDIGLSVNRSALPAGSVPASWDLAAPRRPQPGPTQDQLRGRKRI